MRSVRSKTALHKWLTNRTAGLVETMEESAKKFEESLANNMRDAVLEFKNLVPHDNPEAIGA